MIDQEKAQRGQGCIERHFPIKEIIPGVLEMLGTLRKIKGEQLLPCYKYRPSRETGNNCRKPKKSRHFLCPLIPTRAFEGSLDDSEGNSYGGNRLGEKYARLRKYVGKPCWVKFPQRRNYPTGVGDAWGPSKNQRCAGNWQQLSKTRENQTTCVVPTHSHLGLRNFFRKTAKRIWKK